MFVSWDGQKDTYGLAHLKWIKTMRQVVRGDLWALPVWFFGLTRRWIRADVLVHPDRLLHRNCAQKCKSDLVHHHRQAQRPHTSGMCLFCVWCAFARVFCCWFGWITVVFAYLLYLRFYCLLCVTLCSKLFILYHNELSFALFIASLVCVCQVSLLCRLCLLRVLLLVFLCVACFVFLF